MGVEKIDAPLFGIDAVLGQDEIFAGTVLEQGAEQAGEGVARIAAALARLRA